MSSASECVFSKTVWSSTSLSTIAIPEKAKFMHLEFNQPEVTGKPKEKAGRITNPPELNAFIKEPTREGFRYGESLG